MILFLIQAIFGANTFRCTNLQYKSYERLHLYFLVIVLRVHRS